MKGNKKKGFTLVELLVVVAILAILATVSILGYSSFTKKANLSNDNTVITELNRFVDASKQLGNEFNTITDVAEMLSEEGFELPKLHTSSKGYHYAYDIKADKFTLLDDDFAFAEGYKLESDSTNNVFAFLDSKADFGKVRDDANRMSIYLQATFPDDTYSNLEVHSGLDVGVNTGIKTIAYSNSGTNAQDVVIRTNSAITTLSINAPLDDINHFGIAGVVNLTKVAETSYYEHGSVAYIELIVGRIVLTEDSDVEVINVSKKDANTYNNPIIADGGVLEENMPEIISRDQVTVTDSRHKTELVRIQTLDENGNEIISDSEQVWAYSNGTVGTTEKITTGTDVQNEHIESPLGLIVLDSGSHAGEKAYSLEEKNSQKDIYINELLDEQLSTNEDYVVRVDDVGYMSLSEAFKHTTDGCVVRLLKDTSMFYTIQIGNSLTFDLNGKTININSSPANEKEVAAVGDWNPIVSNLFDVANGVDLIVTGNGTINTSSNNTDWQAGLTLFNYANSNSACSITIENGTYNVYGTVVTCRYNCTATINGGTFNEIKTTEGTNLFRIHGGKLTFNGGTANVDSNTAAFYLYSSSYSCYCTINNISLNFLGVDNEVIGYCGGETYFYINGGCYLIGEDNIFDHYSDELTELVVSGGSFDVQITDGKYTYDPDWRYDGFIQNGKSLIYDPVTELYEVQ